MIELVRVSKARTGTFGVLMKGQVPICWTLEDPDNDNAQGISCVPEGSYEVVPHNGQKYQNVWILKNVPNREAILIHQGNTINDTKGCILVGRRFGYLGDLPAVLESNQCLRELRDILPKTFNLTIRSI